MAHVHASITLQGPYRKSSVWEHLCNLEQYSEIAAPVDKVVELDKAELSGRSEWHLTIDGAPFWWIQTQKYDPSSYKMKFTAISGDFDEFTGEWQLANAQSQGVDIDINFDYRLGIPVLEDMIVDTLRYKMKNTFESILQGHAAVLSSGARDDRRFSRISIRKTVQLGVNGRNLHVFVQNISQGGIYVELEKGMLYADHSDVIFSIEGLRLQGKIHFEYGETNHARMIFTNPISQRELDRIIYIWQLKSSHNHFNMVHEDYRMPVTVK